MACGRIGSVFLASAALALQVGAAMAQPAAAPAARPAPPPADDVARTVEAIARIRAAYGAELLAGRPQHRLHLQRQRQPAGLDDARLDGRRAGPAHPPRRSGPVGLLVAGRRLARLSTSRPAAGSTPRSTSMRPDGSARAAADRGRAREQLAVRLDRRRRPAAASAPTRANPNGIDALLIDPAHGRHDAGRLGRAQHHHRRQPRRPPRHRLPPGRAAATTTSTSSTCGPAPRPC